MVRHRGTHATPECVRALWRGLSQAANWSSLPLFSRSSGSGADAAFASLVNGEDVFLVGTKNQVRDFAETHFENVRTVDVFGIVAHLGDFRLALASKVLRLLKVDAFVCHIPSIREKRCFRLGIGALESRC